MEKVKHGSRIAKQGFANEKDMVKVFNSWRENSTATNLLQAMGYKISEIESVEAKKIPGTVKPDIKVLVTVGEQTDRHKVSCKRLEKRANYNHLCRKSVDKYQTQWGFSTAQITTPLGSSESSRGVQDRRILNSPLSHSGSSRSRLSSHPLLNLLILS